MKVHYGTIYLPHINYTVRIRPFQKPPDRIGKANAWIRHEDKWGCTVYFPKDQSPSEVSHELIHVLQYICVDRYMEFDGEFEHMAYTMQYLMGRVLGFGWVMRPKPKRKSKSKRA